MITRNCKQCNKEFKTFPSRINGKGECCSMTCATRFRILAGKVGFRKGHKDFVPHESRKRQGIKATAENNPGWRGDRVGYTGIHHWIRNHLGKAKKCENVSCFYPRVNANKKILVSPKRYEWANKSGTYSRDFNDWVQLCPSCHRSYDMGLTNSQNYANIN